MLSHRFGRVVPRHDSWAGLGWAVCRLGTVIMGLQSEQSNPPFTSTITAQLTIPASNPYASLSLTLTAQPTHYTAHCCVHHTECCFFDSLLIASANLDGEKQQNIFHRPSILPLRTMECNSIMNYCVSLQPGAGRGRGTAVTASHTLTAVISRISTP